MKIDIVGGKKYTKDDDEDFAITPYLFGVWVTSKSLASGIYGIGICWGWYCFYIAIGLNIPNELRGFRDLTNKTK